MSKQADVNILSIDAIYIINKKPNLILVNKNENLKDELFKSVC